MHKKLFGLLVVLLPLQLGRHWWPGWSYLYGLRMDYWAPTLYLTDLLVLGLIIFSFKFVILNFKSIINFKFLIVLGLLMVGCWGAGNRAVAFLKLIKILELGFLGYYVAKNNWTKEVAARAVIIAVVYSSLIAVGQFVKQGSLGGVFWWLGERSFSVATPGIAKLEVSGQLFLRPYGTFGHPNALAGFLLVGWGLTGWWLWQRGHGLAVSYTVLTGGVIGLTFSRPVWLAGLVILMGVVIQLIKARNFLFYGGWLEWESVTRRNELNERAIQLIKEQPLFGVGLNNFLFRLPFTDFVQPVHNMYLLVASEMGSVVLIIFIVFIIKTIKRNRGDCGLWGGLGTILFTGMFDHYWLTLQQNQLLLVMVIGLCWQKDKTGAKV